MTRKLQIAALAALAMAIGAQAAVSVQASQAWTSNYVGNAIQALSNAVASTYCVQTYSNGVTRYRCGDVEISVEDFSVPAVRIGSVQPMAADWGLASGMYFAWDEDRELFRNGSATIAMTRTNAVFASSATNAPLYYTQDMPSARSGVWLGYLDFWSPTNGVVTTQAVWVAEMLRTEMQPSVAAEVLR